MDTSLNSPPLDGGDSTAAFRKPSNDGSGRKYRRRALADDGSSSSAGSPEHNQSPNLKHSRGDVRKVSEPDYAMKDDKRETDRSHYGRGGFDLHKHDRYSKRDEYSRHERDGSRSSRDSRGGHHSDHRRVETEYSRSRNDPYRHSRDKHKSSGQSHDGNEKTEDLSSGRRQREPRFGDKEKDHVRGRDCKEDKKGSRWSFGDPEINKEKDVHVKSRRDRYDEKCLDTENRDTHSKKMKGFISEKVTHGNSNAEEKHTSGSSLTLQSHSKETENPADVNAARVAAMQAAELVNKNLVGTGFLTTDQKKKLLWGKKKSTVAEESTAHRWDSALIGDRERQEKFNKLMGVKGSVVNQEQNLSEVDVEKQKELQMDLEKQYTAGLRRRDGRTVGLGL